MTITSDAVVVGGGVMGTSILYNLALKGMTRSILLEKNIIGSGSTGRSSGVLRTHYSTEICTKLSQLSYPYFVNWDEMVGGGNVSFVKTGYMVIGDENSLNGMTQNISIQNSLGINSKLLSTCEARELIPSFNFKDSEIAAWEPEAGHADPSGTALAYSARARELGAQVLLESPVTEISIQNGRVNSISTASEKYETSVAIIATGPWSTKIFKDIGLEIPVEATRHQVFLLRNSGNDIPSYPAAADLVNLTYFKPEGTNLTLIGNGNIESKVDPDTYNQKTDMGYVEDIWTRVVKRIPSMADAELYTGYAGLYTSTPDLHPIIDKVPGIDGLFICTGFSGHGFKMSPVVGLCMTELILNGYSSTLDLHPLRITRFEEGDLNGNSYDFKVIA